MYQLGHRHHPIDTFEIVKKMCVQYVKNEVKIIMAILWYIIMTIGGAIIGNCYYNGAMILGGIIGFFVALFIHASVKVGNGDSISDLLDDFTFDSDYSGGGGGFDCGGD